MSTIKNSIRIYIPQGNGIEAGFYDVIGYYGPDILILSDYYIIDVNNLNYPLIKSGTEYFYLPYDSETGYSVSSLNDSDYNNNRVHGLVLNDPMMIYQDRVGDFNGLGYDRPLCQNISINNISTLVVAYRAYHMEIFDSYAIRTFDGTIHDEYNIIDASQEEIILVESNPENYVFDPEGGIVKELYLFTVDCGKQISNVKLSIGAVDICVYEKNTKSIVSHVNSSTIQYSGTSFSFYLSTKVVTSGLYFLYLPSSIIEFVNGTESPFTLIGYKIEVDETGNDIQNYEYQSTGKTLEKVRIKFLNTGTYSIGIDVTKTITVKDNNGNIVLSPNNSAYNTTVTYLNKISNNTIEFDLKKVINNPGSLEIVYTIEIPAETFQLSADDYNTKITLLYTIIPESLDLPVDNNLIVKVEPSSNSNVFKLDKIRVKFYQDNYLSSSTSVWNNSNKAITLTNYNSETVATSSSPSFTPVEYEQGYKVFVFEFQLSNEITTPGSYTLNIPAEKFYIGVGNTASAAITCSYNLIELNKEKYINKYCYEMILIVPTLNEIIEHDNGIELSFRKDNTIFIDGLKMSNILFSPVLSIIEEENNETQRVTYYNPFLNGNDILEMISTLSVQLSDGTEKLETVVYSSKDSNNNSNGFLYGLDLNNNRVAYKLCNFSLGPTQETEGLFFKNERIGQVPRSMSLTIYIKLNGAAVLTGVNIQILDDEVYTKFKENNNWVYEKKIDIYSGEECDHIYVTPSPTESYDSLVKTVTTNDLGELVTRYEVDLAPVTKVRLGNLDGIYNETFGKKQPFGYGLYGLNVFLTGNFLLNNGRSMLDIDNDITMAVGNIANILNGLSELENRLDENSRLFDKKVSNAEKGVSSTISNYISTNRDAIFKLGLDYSMWSLGSAGISLYNPNVKYKTNESGERVVDENTVGDFDEGVLIQADRLRINNYKSVKIGNDTYYQVLITSVNPKDWVYPPANAGEDSNVLFFPKAKDLVSGYRKIPFYYKYINQEDFTNGKFKLDSTLGCDEILKYVYIAEDSEGNPYALESLSLISNLNVLQKISYSAYAFNSFYTSTSTSVFYNIDSSNVVSDAGITDQVWFLPTIILAALFNNGKIYAKYIETEGLQVEHVIAIPKSYTRNGITREMDIDYRKNEAFDIQKIINESNYPVVLDVEDPYHFDENNNHLIATESDRDVPFVIISGYTGRLTARSADIQGSLRVGDSISNDSSYIVITDNKDQDTAVEYSDIDPSPAIYMIKRRNGEDSIVSKFSTINESNMIEKFEKTYDSFTDFYYPGPSITETTSKYVSFTHYVTNNLIYTSPKGENIGYDEIIGGITSENYTDYICYPVDITTTQNTYDEVWKITTIPAGQKDRSVKIHVQYDSLTVLYGNSTFWNYVLKYSDSKWTGSIKGKINIFAHFGIHPVTDTSFSQKLFLFTINTSQTFYNGSFWSINHLRRLKHAIITLPASDTAWEIYCEFKTTSDYYSKVGSLLPPGTNFTCSFLLGGFKLSVLNSSLEYSSTFSGNGMASGFDNNNYFGSFYLNDSNNSLKMIHAFKCGGFGMKFGPNKFTYLLPNNYYIPMFIPVIYFDINPEGDIKLIVPTKTDNFASSTVWLQGFYNDEHTGNWRKVPDRSVWRVEWNNDLIIFLGLRGDDWYDYPNTYENSNGGSITDSSGNIMTITNPRGGNRIDLNADFTFEFCLTPLFNILNLMYNINMNSNNIRVNMTRKWKALMYGDGSYFTDQGRAWETKYDVIENNTVYFSAAINDGFGCSLTGQIEIFIPADASTTPNYRDAILSLYQGYKTRFNLLNTRYLALTNEQQANSGVADLLSQASDKLNDILDCTTLSEAQVIALNLETLFSLIDSGLTTAENTTPSEGDTPSGDTITITLHSDIVNGISADGITGGTVTIATFTPTTYEGTASVDHTSGATILKSLAVPQAGTIIGAADPNSSTSTISETLTLTIGQNSLTFTVTQLGASSGGNTGGDTPTPISWSSASFTYDGTNLSSAPTLTIPSGVTVVSYTSSDSSVAVINSSGTITPVSGVTSGSTTITAVDSNSNSASYTFIINILSSSLPNSFDSIELNYLEKSTVANALSVVGGSDIDTSNTDSDIFNFIARAYKLSYSLAPKGTDFSTITDGPINTISTSGGVSAYMLVALIVTMMYPFTGTTAVTSDSAAQSRKNNVPLYNVFSLYGPNATMNEGNYKSKHQSFLAAIIGFARMLGNADFRQSLNNIKNTNYTSAYTKKFYYNDATDFLSSSAAPAYNISGSSYTNVILPSHPGTNIDTSTASLLMLRDINSYTSGKNLRDYSTSTGKKAYDDRNESLKYLIEICQSASNASVGSYTDRYGHSSYAPADDPNNSYHGGDNGRGSSGYTSDSVAYTETGWSTFLADSSHGKTDLLNNKKFAHLYFALKTGVRTVNLIKDYYSRTRPFEVYNEASSSSDYDSDFSNGITGVDSDTAKLLGATSYPSGHTGYMWGFALVWTSLFNLSDANAFALFKRAYQYSQGRVIVGAHWQYCVEMARLAAGCSFAMMCANQLFINSLDTALSS